MPRRTDQPSPAAGAAATAEPPVKALPVVEQVTEDEGTSLHEAALDSDDLLNDPAWLLDTVNHRLRCPMTDAPLEGNDAQPGRLQRMEYAPATAPRTDQSPVPMRYMIVRCIDCGAAARIEMGRVFS